SARGVHAVECDQSGRLLLLHSVALRCAGAIRPRWPLRPMEYDRCRDLSVGDPGSNPVSFHGVLHGPAGGAAGRCGYLLDRGFARARRAVLRVRARLAAARAAAAHLARVPMTANLISSKHKEGG